MKKTHIIIILSVFLLLLSGCGNKYNEIYQEAIKYLEAGDYEQAILYFDQAIDIDSKQYEAWSGRGQAHYYNSQEDEAFQDYLKATDLGMSANELPEEMVQSIVSSFVTSYETDSKSKEELMGFLQERDFFSESVIYNCDSALTGIIIDVAGEYANNGKSIHDLYAYLEKLGLITNGEVSEAIWYSWTGTLIGEIIQYKNDGKSVMDFFDHYGGGVISLGKTFRFAVIEDVIARIPDFSQRSQMLPYGPGDGTLFNLWYVYDIGTSSANQIQVFRGSMDDDMIQFFYNDLLVVVMDGNGYFALDNGINNHGLRVYVDENHTVTDVRIEQDYLRGTYDEYERAIASWNELLSPYGMTVDDIFDTKSVRAVILMNN